MIAANVFPINLLFKSEFVQCFANFVTARKGTGRALPSEDVCSSIGSIVYCVLGHAEEESWSEEKIFKEFESNGMLEQILRCSTVPTTAIQWKFFFWILELLQTCARFLTRKFKSGKPCGDTLRAILTGH